MKLTGSQIFVEVLVEQGVDTLFGYPGGAVLNLYDELYKNSDRIRHVLTAHEQGASHAADGYARATGRTGVVLLYGDAGTGKSSTVKAIANEFAPDGLRLIEVKKNQLYQIPALMDELAKNPLKFILFIDDLSFASNDDNFAALKAILEGGVGGRSHNVAVYATSNRRHLVKETMADRSGDDLHAMDTRQELMSLSARFGLTVTFQQPDKDRYDRILLELAKQYNVQMPSDQLFIKGAAFALRAGGRSPRVAKQFVELLAAGVKV